MLTHNNNLFIYAIWLVHLRNKKVMQERKINTWMTENTIWFESDIQKRGTDTYVFVCQAQNMLQERPSG